MPGWQASPHQSIRCYDASSVRTTISLDPDTRLLVERAMRERGLTFKEAVNQAIRAGLAAPSAEGPASYTTPRALGPARLDLTKALGLAAQLEDEALTHRLAEGR
jgi:hypothetical protein